MKKLLQNCLTALILVTAIYFIFVNLFMPETSRTMNNDIFFNDSLAVTTFVFIFLSLLSYSSMKKVIFPNEFERDFRVYKGCRAIGIFCGALFMGYRVVMKLI